MGASVREVKYSINNNSHSHQHSHSMDLAQTIDQIGRNAQASSRVLARMSTVQKDHALAAVADQIERDSDEILSANSADLDAAQSLGAAMLDRLRLDPERIKKIAQSVRAIAELKDPVGEVLKEWERPNGLKIAKVRVPIGVIGIIYESRPNVTIDAASLCLKTGNAVILRGGSESVRSNTALAGAFRRGCISAGLPEHAAQLVPGADRAAVPLLAQMDQYVHLIIPRGGKALIETVAAAARVPVIKHFDGICHFYIDDAADLKMAEDLVLNAKCQRPGVCNAVETLLVHANIASDFLPRCAETLSKHGVELRGDETTQKILGELVKPAAEADWSTEYLDLILSIRVVANLDDAIEHIETYGSHHSDGIVTESAEAAEKFLRSVDSAAVFWNASTRFNDGGEFGFGAEIGISTARLHARGPMGLEELTSYKYVVKGSGQIR
jgi:glutamate-5-semialdehyde dehydrogenase